MKKVILFLAICFAVGMQAQPLHNFIIEDNNIIWQRIYESTLTKEDIYTAMNESGMFTEIVNSENKITAQVKDFPIDYKSAGYTSFDADYYIPSNNFSGFIIVEFKENQYRITFKKIWLKSSGDITMYMSVTNESNGLEFYVLKNGKFRNAFVNKGSIILNYDFKNRFAFKKSDSW